MSLLDPDRKEFKYFNLFIKKVEIYLAISLFLFIFIIEVKCKAILILSVMNKFQRETLKVRLIKLARLRSTGAPSELAEKFEIAERSVKRIIKEIRDSGIDMRYCRRRRSYVTGKEYQ
jgi:biotin operon repressor